jgi:UDP-N-acetyl-D-glucosamine dehydrogenase
VAYKRDVNDMRESPALDIMELLGRRGAVLSYSDPYVPELKHGGDVLTSVELRCAIEQKPDCFVICTDHSVFEYGKLLESRLLIVDTRNALKGRESPAIFRL